MRYCLDIIHRAVADKRRPFRQRPAISVTVVAVVWLGSLLVLGAMAQEPGLLPALEPNELEAGPPVSHVGGGSFFSQELGSMLRVRYNTESYGQGQRGNLDIGTMQVFNYDDAITFIDGQITLNDEQGTGFNVGVGYRRLAVVPFPWDPERIIGLSLWVDGTSTEADNFFPQLGVSYESLGDCWDFRANGYFPLGDQDQIGKFVPTGQVGFQDNFLAELTQATVDTSFKVVELEAARRLGAERDAWLFGGGYVLANDDQDAGGYRLGLRGYAYPDVMVQFAVSDDEIFNTNATFSLIWFVGRTRSDYRPTCGLPDRFREPVLRNDYVALAQSTVIGGDPLTDANGAALRFVHVDSDAPDGGDGTYENPLNDLGLIDDNSQERDIILAWSDSVFTSQQALLQDNQALLGEGDDMPFSVFTSERGAIEIPETSPGARSGDRPVIMDSGGDAVTLADSNDVANLEIDGGTNGIVAGANGAGNPNLRDLSIHDLTGSGIVLNPFVLVDTEDIDGDGNTTERFVRFNVTIDNVTFDNVAGDDINLDAFTTENVDSSQVTLQEQIAISNVTSTNNGGRGIFLQNTHSAGTAAISMYSNTTGGTGMEFDDISGDLTLSEVTIEDGAGYALDFLNVGTDSNVSVDTLAYDGGAGAAGGIRMDNFDGTFTATNSSLTGGTLEGVSILNGSEGTFSFDSTNTFDSIAGTTFFVDGGGADEFVGSLSVESDFTSDAGQSVVINNIGTGASITFLGNITDNGDGLSLNSNAGGSVLFSGDLTMDTGANTAILLTDNTDTNIDFGGNLDITTTTGTGFQATGGGNLTASGTTNSITTETGTAVRITDMAIAGLGVNFGQIDVTQAGATNAAVLQDNTGGPIVLGTLGDNAGESGTIEGTTDDAIVINNSANVTVSGLEINNTNPFAGVRVTQSGADTMTVNLNDLAINDGDFGVEVTGGGAGNLNMTINDTDINGSADTGLSFDNVDHGTIQVNNVTIDGNNANATAQGVVITDSDASFTFDSDTVIQEFGGTDFEVFGGAGTVSMQGDITNSTAANAGDTTGQSIFIHGITGGSVTMTGTVDDDNEGIQVANNTGGTTNLAGDYTVNTGANPAVRITSNTGADVSIGNFEITTTTGAGFVATGGGNLTVTGSDNTISTGTGTGLTIDGMNVVSQANFESVSSDGAASGIVLNNVTGSTVRVGDSGNDAGDGGTIQNTTGPGVSITNTANAELNGVKVVDATGDAISIVKSTNPNMSVTLNDTEIDTTGDGLFVNGSAGSGTFNVTSSGGTIAADGTALEVTGRVSTVSSSDDISDSATAQAIHVHDLTAGTVTHTGSVTNSGTGILVEDNTGGDVNLLGQYTLSTGANDAVTVNNNTGASVDFSGLDITTTSGDGFVATNGGTLSVIGTTNKISTDTGVGLDIEDMTIGGAGVNFQEVSVSNGGSNGIVLDTLTGGSVNIGNAAGATNSGGSLTTDDTAILVNDVENLNLQHVHIVDTTNALAQGISITHSNAATTGMDVTINDLNLDDSMDAGISVAAQNNSSSFAMRLTNGNLLRNVDIAVTGGGNFGLLVDATAIDTSAGGDIAFELSLSGSAKNGDVTFRNGNNFLADDASALDISTSGATAKNIKLLIDGTAVANTFANNSAGSAAADFLSAGNTLFQSTIQGNSFANANGAGSDFTMTTTGGASARMRLNLGGTETEEFNTAAGALGQFTLKETADGSDFDVFESVDTFGDLRNTGTVVTDPNDAAFDDLPAAPALPTVP